MNVCTLLGHLTRDPEYRDNGNVAFCRGGIAVNVGFGDKKKTMFLDYTLFGKRAESFRRFHAKGSKALLTGYLEPNEWTDKATGEKRSKIGLVVNDYSLVGSKPEAIAPPPSSDEPDWMTTDGPPF